MTISDASCRTAMKNDDKYADWKQGHGGLLNYKLEWVTAGPFLLCRYMLGFLLAFPKARTVPFDCKAKYRFFYCRVENVIAVKGIMR